MIWRALAVWFAILLMANVNGALREVLLIRPFGPVAGRSISTLLLCAIIVLISWLSIDWIKPATRAEAVQIGILWLVLTLAFEFLVGHYVFRKSWPDLLEDYDLSRGRIWVLALLTVSTAPLLTARLRGLFR
jgi:hypothetical protein